MQLAVSSVLKEDPIYITDFPHGLGLANRSVLQESYSKKIKEEVVLLSNTLDKTFPTAVLRSVASQPQGT